MIPVHRGLDHARPHLIAEADRLAILVEDLRAIGDGKLPTSAVLEASPVVHGWAFALRMVPMVVGRVVGHPRLGDGPVRTTEVIACDLRAGWVRTLSRFYVLGRHASEAGADV